MITSSRGGSPVPAVLAVVVHDRKVLLVRRANPPDAGCWGFPGGHIEWGERLFAAAERELHEETGVEACADEVLTALDVLAGGADECVAHHYVLVAVRCIWRSGSGRPADDARAVDWFTLEQVAALGDTASVDVLALAETALSRHLEKA
ncbi:NUDIX hydrolase [Litchfieldella rifensis]|uniref:NUDIX hydrolase n=1 Tax=Litchfieldella rifensis TaxID=762643 RepID=A0ABV7LRX5_9GAMM